MVKNKIFLSIPIIILIGVVFGPQYVWGPGKLISPAVNGHDQSSKVQDRLSNLSLDYSLSRTLTSLENVPRYLAYNTDNGRVYFHKNHTLKISPASFTKLLSAQIAIDLSPLESDITVRKNSIEKVPTILGLKAGEVISARDLLRGSIATSGNDAAQVLADGVSESIGLFPGEFIYYMNYKSQSLGMSHSHFTNPDGLDDQNQYSTLEDIARLVHNVQKNYPEIITAAKSDNQDIEASAAHGKYYLPNWNGLLGVYPGVDGLKIAYTEEAGYSTIVTARRGDVSVVVIVSGTGSYLERDRAAADLLDASFIDEGLPPIRVTSLMLNRHYQVWGDLARKIKSELKNTKL